MVIYLMVIETAIVYWWQHATEAHEHGWWDSAAAMASEDDALLLQTTAELEREYYLGALLVSSRVRVADLIDSIAFVAVAALLLMLHIYIFIRHRHHIMASYHHRATKRPPLSAIERSTSRATSIAATSQTSKRERVKALNTRMRSTRKVNVAPEPAALASSSQHRPPTPQTEASASQLATQIAREHEYQKHGLHDGDAHGPVHTEGSVNPSAGGRVRPGVDGSLGADGH